MALLLVLKDRGHVFSLTRLLVCGVFRLGFDGPRCGLGGSQSISVDGLGFGYGVFGWAWFSRVGLGPFIELICLIWAFMPFFYVLNLYFF